MKLELKEFKKKLNSGYWICNACAIDNGATVPPIGVSGGYYTCPICDLLMPCVAITDWHWPKEVGIRYVWD